MQRRELADLSAGPAEAREHFLRRMIDDADFAVHAVDHVDELLRRVGREHEIVDRPGAKRRPLEDMLSDKGAVLLKHLKAVIRTVADVNELVFADADAVNRIA